MCILSIKTINKSKRYQRYKSRINNTRKKKPVALLVYRNFSSVHTDRALPSTRKGGWEFSTSQSSAMRSPMVSASGGPNTKYGEAPMRFRPGCLNTLGNKHLRVSNNLKCSQTLASDKTATGSLRLPYGMPESTST